MSNNVSVERFKKLTEELQQEIHDQAVTELNSQASELAQLIASVAPVYSGIETGATPGALKASVRVVPGNKDTIVRVVAGGALTIRPGISSKPYDYARADEFGTVKMHARPFFFPTYRLRKKKIIAAMKRNITTSIKKAIRRMSDPSLELQAAVVGALKANPGVAAIVGTRVYDNVPENATFPYISLGDDQVLPDKADCIDGTEIFVRLDGWARDKTFPMVKQISKAVVAALDDQPLTVSGYSTVVFELDRIDYLHDPDGLTRHVALSFRVLIQAL